MDGWISLSLLLEAIAFSRSNNKLKHLITSCHDIENNSTTGQHAVRPRGYKTFSMLNSAEHEIILPINVKMPTIVGMLTFISMINTTSEGLKARNFFICQYFSFYEQLEFCAQLS